MIFFEIDCLNDKYLIYRLFTEYTTSNNLVYNYVTECTRCQSYFSKNFRKSPCDWCDTGMLLGVLKQHMVFL